MARRWLIHSCREAIFIDFMCILVSLASSSSLWVPVNDAIAASKGKGRFLNGGSLPMMLRDFPAKLLLSRVGNLRHGFINDSS